MNKCFFIGQVIEVQKFKFILNKNIKHKSEIGLKIKLLDKNCIRAVAYDGVADYVLRNIFCNSMVCVQGRMEQNKKILQVVIKYIEKC
ncbi:MAG: hypothetical protein IKE01_06970 [Clostridia bacterium]|nr:hypothetical protein [Clostridia bacterium]